MGWLQLPLTAPQLLFSPSHVLCFRFVLQARCILRPFSCLFLRCCAACASASVSEGGSWSASALMPGRGRCCRCRRRGAQQLANAGRSGPRPALPPPGGVCACHVSTLLRFLHGRQGLCSTRPTRMSEVYETTGGAAWSLLCHFLAMYGDFPAEKVGVAPQRDRGIPSVGRGGVPQQCRRGTPAGQGGYPSGGRGYPSSAGGVPQWCRGITPVGKGIPQQCRGYPGGGGGSTPVVKNCTPVG